MLNQNFLLEELQKLDPKIAEKWDKIVENAGKDGVLLTDYIQSKGFVPEEALKPIIAQAYGVEPAPDMPSHLADMTARYVPMALAQAQHLVVFEDEDLLKIATINPDNATVFDALQKKLQREIKIFYAFRFEVEASLKKPTADVNDTFDKIKTGVLKDITSIESLKNSTKLLDSILITSLEHKASDIHIEPHEGRLIVRFRVDGVLKDIIELPKELADVIVSRIKVLAELRTDEHFKPQDGRFKVALSDNNEVTTRVSILPVYDGEKVVMRILKAKKQKTDLTDLGYTPANQGKIYNNAEKAHGMLLVTGPTGSGKTTTIYTVLKLLNKPEVNITTVEDPIEYKLDRVNQIQVNQAAGLTFASGLRSILRQDPDVVMIGEIRDEETASIAVNAALTGHLVLATLHTNSAIDTLPRLLEMQVEPYLVASTVNVVIAQRLVRKLCDKCKKPMQVSQEVMDSIAVDDSEFSRNMLEMAKKFISVGDTVYQPGGCNECGNKGFEGRLAIAEVLDVTDEIKEAIYGKKSPLEIEQIARDQGYITFMEDALLKVKEGSTSLDEVIRVTKE